MTCYGPIGVWLPLKYVAENSMERLSGSESILNVGQLLKQRWSEPGLQTGGSLSKYNGAKRDSEQQ